MFLIGEGRSQSLGSTEITTSPSCTDDRLNQVVPLRSAD
uniref:Uncharacterized protein n=1 Tax=Arundo donax TaxID=35708 RepID=A0A0A9DSI6_ARUDO